MKTLRPYQEKIRREVHEAYREFQSVLAVMATGCGKTLTAATIIKDFQPKRTLWIVHTRDLVFQAARHIGDSTGLDCQIEMAELSAVENLYGRADVVVASRDTLISGGERKRFARFDPSAFGLVVIDEAHHATNDSYAAILDHFKKSVDTKILGLTATPNRSDEVALGKVFQHAVEPYEALKAIGDGYLVRPHTLSVVVDGLDFSAIKTTAGDLNGAELAAVMEAEAPMQMAVQASYEAMYNLEPMSLKDVPHEQWAEYCLGRRARKTIAFCVRVQHAEMLANIINRIQPNIAAMICGETPPQDRHRILDQYRKGEIQYLTNVAVAIEGFDVPEIEVLVDCAPTKSLPRFQQKLGRLLRTWPGCIDPHNEVSARLHAIMESPKPFGTILDFVGNTGKHKLVTTVDALAGDYSDEAVSRAKKKAEKEGTPADVIDLLKQSAEEIQEELKKRQLEEAARRNRIVAKSNYSVRSMNVFDVFDIEPPKIRGWDMDKKLTEKQISLLAKQGVSTEGMSYTEGKALLDEFFRRWKHEGGALCSLKQAKLLQRHGYNTKELTMKEAGKLIDALAKNGWKRPTESKQVSTNSDYSGDVPF